MTKSKGPKGLHLEVTLTSGSKYNNTGNTKHCTQKYRKYEILDSEIQEKVAGAQYWAPLLRHQLLTQLFMRLLNTRENFAGKGNDFNNISPKKVLTC